jgi:MarR family transcriptional regulator, organic hydroperoxide resistance regulator
MVGKLKDEIRQSRPFTSLEEECYLTLVRTADALARKEVDALKAWRLTPTQYNALRILRGAGEQGARCGEVGERMLTRDPDVTRLIDRLEARGLIQRTRSEEDRRVVRTRITRAGLDLLEQLDEPAMNWSRAQLGHLTRQELRDLIALLDRARAPG